MKLISLVLLFWGNFAFASAGIVPQGGAMYQVLPDPSQNFLVGPIDPPSAATPSSGSAAADCRMSGGQWVNGDSAVSSYCDTSSSSSGPSQATSQCRSRVQQTLQQCQAARSSAGNSCDADANSQLASLNSEGQRLQQDLQSAQGEYQTTNVCRKNGDFQSRYSQAAQRFSGICQSAVSSCTGSCQNVAQVAQSGGCAGDSVAAGMVNQANGAGGYCSSTLQTRATQASQQAQAQRQTVDAAKKCAAGSTADMTDSTQISNSKSGLGSPNSGSGPAAALGNSNGPASDGQQQYGSEMDPGTAPARGGVTTDSEDLASLPTRKPTVGVDGQPNGRSNDSVAMAAGAGSYAGSEMASGVSKKDPIEAADVKKSKFQNYSSSGDYSGGGGGGGFRSWLSRSWNSVGETLGIISLPEKKPDGPDLRAFLPNMARRVIASQARVALGMHSSLDNMFSKVHDRYVALGSTLPHQQGPVQTAAYPQDPR